MKYLTLFLVTACSLFAPRLNPWEQFTGPTSQPAEVIGYYSKGCLKGAKVLPADGKGYQTMKLNRNRFYGHPNLIQFIQDLGSKVQQAKLGDLLIGDLALPRGGYFAQGHASHQTGLDVDIWFYQHDKRISMPERENMYATSYANNLHNTLKANWNTNMDKILEIAAKDEKVDRIFVNPSIKQKFCLNPKTKNETWLAKIRPWYRHDDHFHVRLKCPKGSKDCVDQKPVTDTECTGNLEWWFSADFKEEFELAKSSPAESKAPKLPAQCLDYLKIK